MSVAKVDYTAVAAGEPLMTASFQRNGHNVYKGIGGVESIDWSTQVACTRHDQNQVAFQATLAPGQRHVYAARAVSTAGVEERNTHVTAYLEVDEQGSILPSPLSSPIELTTTVQIDASMLASFSHEVGDGESEPTSFELLSDFGTGEIDLQNPVDTLSDIAPGQKDFEFLVTSPILPALFTVRSRRDEQASPLCEVVSVHPRPSPQPPTLL